MSKWAIDMESEGVYAHQEAYGIAIVDETGHLVAALNEYEDVPEALERGKLIALAPEMAEALRNICLLYHDPGDRESLCYTNAKTEIEFRELLTTIDQIARPLVNRLEANT